MSLFITYLHTHTHTHSSGCLYQSEANTATGSWRGVSARGLLAVRAWSSRDGASVSGWNNSYWLVAVAATGRSGLGVHSIKKSLRLEGSALGSGLVVKGSSGNDSIHHNYSRWTVSHRLRGLKSAHHLASEWGAHTRSGGRDEERLDGTGRKEEHRVVTGGSSQTEGWKRGKKEWEGRLLLWKRLELREYGCLITHSELWSSNTDTGAQDALTDF